jgi:DNA-binding transcriptional MerR regulator
MEVPIQQPLLPREFYKIGEVAAALGVPPSAVRFWKDQFPTHVRPRRSATQHLVFSRRDVVVLALVRFLVHDQKLPLKTARERLAGILHDHEGDTDFVQLVPQVQGPIVEEAMADGDGSRGFLARVEDLRAQLDDLIRQRDASDERAAAAVQELARLRAEHRRILGLVRRQVVALKDEIG